MKVLEVFCGTKSFSNIAKEKGYDIFTIDFNPKFKPDLVCDMLYFNKMQLPKQLCVEILKCITSKGAEK